MGNILNNKEEEEDQNLDNLINKATFNKIQECFNVQKTNFSDPYLGNIDVLQSKFNPNFKLSEKSLVSMDQDQYKKTTEQFQNRYANLNHPNLINLITFKGVSNSNMCSKMFKHTLVLDYIEQTMEEEMQMMGQNKFNEDDIWFFIDSTVGSLSFLEKKGLKHESLQFKNIYSVKTPENIKLFKISDAILMNYETNYQSALRILQNEEEKEGLKGIYLSPEQLHDLQNRIRHPTYNPIKSDVYTLGMMILCLISQNNLEQIYNWQYCQIEEQNLNKIIQYLQINNVVSQNLIDIVRKMIQKDPDLRYDFVSLDAFISQNILSQGKRVCDFIQPGNYRVVPQDQLKQEVLKLANKGKNEQKQEPKPEQQNENQDDKTKAEEEKPQEKTEEIQQPNQDQQQQQQEQQPPVFNPKIYQSMYSQNPQFQQQSQLMQQTMHLNNIQNHMDDQILDMRNLTPEQQLYQQQLYQTMLMQQYQQQQLQQQFAMLQQQQFSMMQQQTAEQLSQYKNNDQFMSAMQHQMQGKEAGYSNQQIQQHYTQQKTQEKVSFEELNLKNEYSQIKYPNGGLYEGSVFNGLRNGQGKLTFPDGGYYEGEWQMNKMNGEGCLHYKDGAKAYSGHWSEDKFHKLGNLFNNQVDMVGKEYDYKNFETLGNGWEKYEGEFNMDLKEGFGVLYLSNGEKYAGNFKQDKLNGYGTFYCHNGQTINGYWENNIMTKLI